MKNFLLLICFIALAISSNADADLIATSDSIPEWSSEFYSAAPRNGLPERESFESPSGEQTLMEEIIIEFQRDAGDQNILDALGDNSEPALTDRLCQWELPAEDSTLAPDSINNMVALMNNFSTPQDPWDSLRSNNAISQKLEEKSFPQRSSRRSFDLIR